MSGSWTKLATLPTTGLGTMLMLPNGDVMVQGPGVANTWYELQPDSSGSYVNGTWTQLASMSQTRLYFGSAVLPNDKVFVLGGEYPSFGNTGELYNIATNSWTSTKNFPQSGFGDDPTDVLPNGDILAGYFNGPQTYLYNPATNTWSNGPTKLDGDASDEETWVKLPVSAALPQGGILSYSIFASISSGTFMGQVYNIATNTWTETKNSASNPPQQLSSDAIGAELGGAVVLPNGMVFQIGANGNTALYDPSTNTWSAGPQILDKSGNLCGSDDAPASILPDGQVVFSADFGPTSGTFSAPAELFDYDYNTNTITQITGLPNTLNGDITGGPAYVDRSIVLPSGQLLFNDGINLFVFTPSDSPQNAWRPTITNITKTGNTSYTLTGTQLSGISEGSSYGDDVNVSENYPIVQLTASNGNVFYVPTSNWSNVLISPVGDTTVESVDFTLPNGFPNGIYQAAVIANGISSTPQSISIGFAKVATTAQNASTTFSPNNQTVGLTANVNMLSGAQTVNEGTVTFTIKDSKGNPIGSAVTGNVSSGTASANYTLPANEPAGTYTVAVSFSDSSNNFVDSGDTNATLTVTPAQSTTAAVSTLIAYRPIAQTVTLSANLADKSIPSDKVGEGTVTFTVKNGGTIVGSVPGAVSDDKAIASFTVPAGLAAGSYTVAVSYSDSAGNFTDNGDTSGSLTIVPAKVSTTANTPPTVFYDSSSQTVALSANVADASFSSDTVTEGSVTFTLKNGGTVLGSAVGTVSGGTASANLTVPAGLAPGSYTVAVSYSDGAGNFSDSSDTNTTLTLAHASVTTTANNPSLIYSTSDQSLTLSATVKNTSILSDSVNEGSVVFTLLSGSTIIGNVLSSVSGGTASANLDWSAGRPIGTYTIAVSYSDSSGNYTDSGDTNGTLTVAPASVTTAASTPPAVVHSSSTQPLALHATIADASFSGDKVNEGVVTFKIENGSTVIGSVSGAVSSGAANASFTVPAGQAVGTYTIAVSYKDAAGNFSDSGSGDSNGSFTITAANVAVTANNASAIYSPNDQSLALSANVANLSVPSQAVSEGNVTFNIMNGSMLVGSIAGAVSGSKANANFTVPAGLAPGSYTIDVSYNDSLGSFLDSSSGDTNATLTVTTANVTTTAGNTSTVFSPSAQTLTLNANVADISIPSDTVNAGTVLFTITSGGTTVGSVSGTVSGGKASANFTLPAGQAVGKYTIEVGYSDSAKNFVDDGDTFATLTVTPANVTTTAGNDSTIYSTKAQTLALSASIADTTIPSDTVNEGAVTFTIQSGSTVVGSVVGAVSGGKANANFTLPGSSAAGSYTVAVSYGDSAGNFSDSGDTNATLTVAPANVTTTASNVSTAFSTSTQIVKLSAQVADVGVPSDKVNEGVVTFTIENGSTVIGSVAGTVGGGIATAAFNVPAGLAPGSYSVAVSYSDSAGNFNDSGDTGSALTVSHASVTPTATASASAVYSLSSQSLTLHATIADASVPSDTINEGTVAFTIKNGSTTLGSVAGTVNDGTASADFTLPAGLPAGSYTIDVSYSDSAGNFSDGGDTSAALTIAPASATTSAIAASTLFRTTGQTVTLSATVADPGGPADNTVNEGAVTFMVLSGSTVIGGVRGTVTGGAASANLTLPAGLAAGSYTIAVGYSDSQGNFSDSGDTSANLIVGPSVTTAQLTQVSLAPTLFALISTETLTAHVSSSTPVTQGSVTFFVSGHAVTANVDGNGNATATVIVPMLDLLGPQSISVNYNDAPNNLTASANTQTPAWQLFNPVLPTTATFTPSGQTITADLFGLFITYTNGHLAEIDLGSTHLVFIYNDGGQLIGATLNGHELLS